jgi:hypothetical protein
MWGQNSLFKDFCIPSFPNMPKQGDENIRANLIRQGKEQPSN